MRADFQYNMEKREKLKAKNDMKDIKHIGLKFIAKVSHVMLFQYSELIYL